MKKVIILMVVATLALGGCTSMNATTAQRALAGGALGASSGALIGWAAGSPAIGAGVGGGLGIIGGYLYDQYEKTQGSRGY